MCRVYTVRMDIFRIWKYKKILRKEGFTHVYLHKDSPHMTYEGHEHSGRVSLFVVRGSLQFLGGIQKLVVAGERFNVTPGVLHGCVVGDKGCVYVVGEEIEGDA